MCFKYETIKKKLFFVGKKRKNKRLSQDAELVIPERAGKLL
jgi:hypothetical protein